MNEKEIDNNLLEVEKGNKRYGIYLKNHIQDQHNRIHDLLKDNTEYKLENERLNNIINELEKDMNNYYEEYKDVDDIVISENARVIKIYLDKLKELKESK